MDLIEPSPDGPYCPAGNFHIDPWRPVSRAVITHAHSDHARPGSRAYLCEATGAAILRARVGPGAIIETLAYGEPRRLGQATVSLHPAGHILGSSQIRVEVSGEVWVFSGDYNPSSGAFAGPAFEPVPCQVFITESTFGLPIYRWPAPHTVFAEIAEWWRRNQERGFTSVLPAYPLGKSQRLLAHLDPAQGPLALHGSVRTYVPLYAEAGVPMPPTLALAEADLAGLKGRGLVIVSSAAQEVGLLKKLAPLSWAFASGWMMTRAARRNRDFDRGFILSDHADWPGLIAAIRATGASRIGVTHGQTDAFSRWLREQGWDAYVFPTRYQGEGLHEGLEAPEESAVPAREPGGA